MPIFTARLNIIISCARRPSWPTNAVKSWNGRTEIAIQTAGLSISTPVIVVS
jgi:hypothetical protein